MDTLVEWVDQSGRRDWKSGWIGRMEGTGEEVRM
jgi:hypothetical protein